MFKSFLFIIMTSEISSITEINLSGKITINNLGQFVKAISLIQEDPIQMKLINAEDIAFLQILNEGELLLRLLIMKTEAEDPMFDVEELSDVAYSNAY